MKPEDQFSSEIAPGIECYHKRAIIFAGGEEHAAEARECINNFGLKEGDYEIVTKNGNLNVVLVRDVIR